MQTDPSGNLLTATKITSTIKRRKVALLVELNYHQTSGTAKDTTTWFDGGWTNETGNVQSVSGAMQLFPPDDSIMQVGNSPPASCRIMLRNWNADGPATYPFSNFSSLTTSLISFWKLDESSGNALDAVTGTANDLTDTNTVTSAGGVSRSARQFTAANSEYFTRADNASLSTGDIDFTISAWVYLDSKSSHKAFVAKWTSTGNQREYALVYTTATDRFRFSVSSDGSSSADVDADTLGSPSTATWYHIVCWHDASANTINIRVNDGATDSTAHSTGVLDTTAAFTIGRWNGADTRYMDGRIDEVGFWKKVLTATERTQLYRGGMPRFSPNRTDAQLYTYTRMDGGANGIYQMPVRVWVGFYDHPSQTPASVGSLRCGTDMTAVSYRETTTNVLNDSGNIAVGQILRWDSEDMVVIRNVSGSTWQFSRGFNGTTIAAHAEDSAATIVGAVTPQFCGVVHNPDETSARRTMTLDCFDRAYILQQAKITAPTTGGLVLENKTADYIIGQYLDALPASPVFQPVASGDRDFDDGIYPVPFAWADDSPCWFELAALASADGGTVHFSKAGDLRYFNSQHYYGASSQYTFDRANAGDVRVKPDYSAIMTNVIASYSTRRKAPPQIVYALTESIVVPPGTTSAVTTLAAAISTTTATTCSLTTAGGMTTGSTFVVDQEQFLVTSGGGTTTPTLTRAYLGSGAATHANGSSVLLITGSSTTATLQHYAPATSVRTMTGITGNDATGDWQAVSGGGSNITSGVTLATTNYAARTEATFTNVSAFFSAYLTKLQMIGTPLQGYPAKRISKTKTPVPSSITKRTRTLPANYYWQDQAQTDAVLDMLADRWKSGRNIVTIADVPGVPQLELGDMVTVTDAIVASASITAHVMRIEWDCGNEHKPEFKQTITAFDSTSLYQSSAYFVVGTSAINDSKVFWY